MLNLKKPTGVGVRWLCMCMYVWMVCVFVDIITKNATASGGLGMGMRDCAEFCENWLKFIALLF